MNLPVGLLPLRASFVVGLSQMFVTAGERATAIGRILRSRIGFGLATLVLSGCAALQPPVRVANEPGTSVGRAFEFSRPVVALVLSGGSARGFAHIGVIKVLEEAGFRPDLVVGTSAGGIIGALYASGKSAAEVERTARGIDRSLFSDLTMPNVGLSLLPGELGLIRGERLQAFVDRETGSQPMEHFPISFAVIVTDLQTGKPVILNTGNAGLAVRASSAVPGVFTPATIRGRLYADGQLTSPVPVTAARQLGAEVVIAVDATFPPDHAELITPLSVLFQAFTIATQRIKDYELGLATIVITPEIVSSTQLTFSDRDYLIALGERAARTALPSIRAMLDSTRRFDRNGSAPAE